jgi:hypothetical protein
MAGRRHVEVRRRGRLAGAAAVRQAGVNEEKQHLDDKEA